VKKNKEKQKRQQISDYVKELYRVYMKNSNPTAEELQQYTDCISDGSQTLQDIEDEFRLLSLSPPDKKI